MEKVSAQNLLDRIRYRSTCSISNEEISGDVVWNEKAGQSFDQGLSATVDIIGCRFLNGFRIVGEIERDILTFNHCIFIGEFDLSNTKLYCDLVFVNCLFLDCVNFESSELDKYLIFKGCGFYKDKIGTVKAKEKFFFERNDVNVKESSSGELKKIINEISERINVVRDARKNGSNDALVLNNAVVRGGFNLGFFPIDKANKEGVSKYSEIFGEISCINTIFKSDVYLSGFICSDSVLMKKSSFLSTLYVDPPYLGEENFDNMGLQHSFIRENFILSGSNLNDISFVQLFLGRALDLFGAKISGSINMSRISILDGEFNINVENAGVSGDFNLSYVSPLTTSFEV